MSITDLQTSKSPTLSGHFANGTIDDEPVGEVNYVSHQKKSGDIIKVSIESSQIDYQGRKAGLYLVKDVTEKLKDEKRRRLLESVVRNTNDAVAILNVAPDAPHPNIIYTNASFRTITGYTDDDVRNRSLSLLTGEQTDPEQLSILENAINNYESADLELIQYTKEGETFWAHVSLVPVEDSDGGHNHMVAIFRDITSRKESEEKIQASLREKEVLLSEIHHRVKNNLALVSGMLQMQVFDEENQEVINKLNNSMLRVETMASIHQLLYESSSFSRLEFSKIISKLIKATHRSFSAGKDIDIEIETEPFELNINQAVPCSLIINEAITNVYKHAFKNRKKGWIKASLHREGDLVTFELEDDGNGLPDDFDINDLSSLGTKIITALVKQLEGEFELKPGNHGGTIFRLTFAAKNGEDSEESSDT
jgi:PAS domain S-box-containing protein